MSNSTNLERCAFFVQRKKRYCKMLVSPGQKFCGEHRPQSEDPEDGKSRIVCPLDNKHTVYAHNLSKHLKVCNARQGQVPAYIKEDVNSGKNEAGCDSSDSHRSLADFSEAAILQTIAKVNVVYDKHVKGRLSSKILSHELVDDQIKPDYGDKTKKHLKQASSILGLLNEYGLLQKNTCFVEFGAGRGQLSCWIADATASLDSTKLLLIEKASPKHKRDNKLAKTTDRIQRIRADIKDLILDEIEMLDGVDSIIGVTKHLCGQATDLAVRCLTNVDKLKSKVKGCLLTFCCHHRCEWTGFTGKRFFRENELSQDDFEVMCGMSSWATCGTGYSRDRTDEGCVKRVKLDEKLNLAREERAEIGRRCKNVINFGRSEFLTGMGFDCSLHYYVDASVTLENVCIVAIKK